MYQYTPYPARKTEREIEEEFQALNPRRLTKGVFAIDSDELPEDKYFRLQGFIKANYTGERPALVIFGKPTRETPVAYYVGIYSFSMGTRDTRVVGSTWPVSATERAARGALTRKVKKVNRGSALFIVCFYGIKGE